MNSISTVGQTNTTQKMGAHTKTGKFAIGFTAIGFIFVLTAMASPYWLVTDGVLTNPKFTNLGLWEVCFNKFRDINRWYLTEFDGCMWVFEEEYYIIHDYLLPSFYIATQFFFTLCFTLLLLGGLMTLLFLGCSRDSDRYILLLLSNGATLVISGLCGFIACVIFGCYGDSRDWMPNWEHNNMGWAFALGVIGSFLLFPAGVLFLVEGRRAKYRRLNEIGNRGVGAYSMETTKSHGRGHTDI